MSDDSPRLALPYVRAGQLQKYVTVNEAFTRLDSLVQMTVQSRSLGTPPGVVEEGQMYIVGSAPAGGWSGFATGGLLFAEMNGWREVEVSDGMIAVVLDERATVVRLSGQWVPISQALGGNLNVEKLGVGADADANNPFSARLNKALWAARPTDDSGTGDLRFTFNKQAASHTASVLFQSAWQGRAEMGLAGDDDFRLKVSADGSGWHEALSVDRATGRVWMHLGATRRETQVFTSGATLTLPAWVRWVEGVCIGGGGGGGAGAGGAAGNMRLGGGGGGAGGYSAGLWSRENLAASLVISVGGAGAGGAAGNGGNGGASSISTHNQIILRATGGNGGQSGGAGGLGGSGGVGQLVGNAGGACEGSVASGGQSLNCPHGPGGGGAGGGLLADNTANSGGFGGAGNPAGVQAAGGSSSLSGSGMGAVSPLPYISRVGGGGGGGPSRANGGGYVGSGAGANGGGGGGGGAGTTSGGNGGPGAAGVVIVTMVG